MIDRRISEKIPVTDNLVLSLDGSTKVEIGFRYYDISNSVVTPTSGTIDVVGKEYTSASDVIGTNSPIDVTTPTTSTFDNDIAFITLTPNTIIGADTYEVYISYSDSIVSGGSGGPLDPVAVKTAYESNANTNAYTDVSKSKVDLFNVRTVTAVSGNFGDSESIIACSTGNITITIETSAITRANQIIYVKDESGLAGGFPITVNCEGSQTIDGLTSIQITANYGVIKMYSDGSNLFTM